MQKQGLRMAVYKGRPTSGNCSRRSLILSRIRRFDTICKIVLTVVTSAFLRARRCGACIVVHPLPYQQARHMRLEIDTARDPCSLQPICTGARQACKNEHSDAKEEPGPYIEQHLRHVTHVFVSVTASHVDSGPVADVLEVEKPAREVSDDWKRKVGYGALRMPIAFRFDCQDGLFSAGVERCRFFVSGSGFAVL